MQNFLLAAEVDALSGDLLTAADLALDHKVLHGEILQSMDGTDNVRKETILAQTK